MKTIEPWIGSSLEPQEGRIELSVECLNEIRETLDVLKANPLPLYILHPDDLPMPIFKILGNKIKKMLSEGIGFCIINRLPLNEMTDEDARSIYWLLAQVIGRPVAQNWLNGRMIYSVTDLGKPSGNGVRPDITNEDQSFHTDNSYNLCPPDIVGLLCLRPSMTGGLSRLVNMPAVLSRMGEEHPDLLSRLYRPYFFDRQREHEKADYMTISKPILCNEKDGLRVRVSRNLIYQGYALQQRQIDDESEAAIDAFFSIIDDPKMYREFQFQPGQIQFINNKLIGHKRTSFADFPDQAIKRHLLRVWLRKKGRPFYNG